MVLEKQKDNIMKNILVITTLIFLAGCSVFPDKTTMSASTKANAIDNPTLKVNQTFKWSKKP